MVPFFKEYIKIILDKIIIGEPHIIIKANFHEEIKPRINPTIHEEILVITKPTLSPIPCSICSNCDCAFIEIRKTLFVSNHPCSYAKIILKYLFFKLKTHLFPIKEEKVILVKLHANEIASHISCFLI